MIATLITKNRHPYIQASNATGINYYQYLDNKIEGHIYANTI